MYIRANVFLISSRLVATSVRKCWIWSIAGILRGCPSQLVDVNPLSGLDGVDDLRFSIVLPSSVLVVSGARGSMMGWRVWSVTSSVLVKPLVVSRRPPPRVRWSMSINPVWVCPPVVSRPGLDASRSGLNFSLDICLHVGWRRCHWSQTFFYGQW